MEKFFKTYEAAKICQVAQGTVIRWIKEGKLPSAATAGGHNRIQAKDLVELLQKLHLPIPAELSSGLSLNEKVRILIVDDEQEVRKMIRWKIAEDFPEAEVEEAEDGFLAGWKANAFRPHLVILDLMLPGLDGYHVCEFIRMVSELKDTKIIAMSALLDPEAAKKILDLGANDFMVKPFDLDVLKKKIFFQLSPQKKKSQWDGFRNGGI